MSLAGLAAFAAPAHALNIKPVFDSTFTGVANAAVIEASIDSALLVFDSAIGSTSTINIDFSWGKVDGQALPANALGASMDPLYVNIPYTSIKYWLQSAAARSGADTALKTAAANLPATSTYKFDLPAAEAVGLGLVSSGTAFQGYVGFGTGVSYAWSSTGVVPSGTYDFTAVVQHEVEEVLGRLSGVPDSGSPSYLTPFDLYRCAGGQHTASSSTAAYFSIDGCKTTLAWFNSQSTGDRGDLNGASNDAQNAFESSGTYNVVQQNDLTELSALGWSAIAPGTLLGSALPAGTTFVAHEDIPEPAPLLVLGLGAMALLTLRRRGAIG